MIDTSQGYGPTGASTQQPSHSGSEDYGASALDSTAYGSQNRAGNVSTVPGNYSSAGGSGSGNMESGSRRNESMMANKMDPSLDNSPRKKLL